MNDELASALADILGVSYGTMSSWAPEAIHQHCLIMTAHSILWTAVFLVLIVVFGIFFMHFHHVMHSTEGDEELTLIFDICCTILIVIMSIIFLYIAGQSIAWITMPDSMLVHELIGAAK